MKVRRTSRRREMGAKSERPYPLEEANDGEDREGEDGLASIIFN